MTQWQLYRGSRGHIMLNTIFTSPRGCSLTAVHEFADNDGATARTGASSLKVALHDNPFASSDHVVIGVVPPAMTHADGGQVASLVRPRLTEVDRLPHNCAELLACDGAGVEPVHHKRLACPREVALEPLVC